MKVLLTGASGRLGNKLISYLSNNGIEVRTLGRHTANSEFENYSWSLGMSPNPQSFVGVDCIIHLAWSTKDRGNYDFHINVGGSSKIIESSILSKVKIINISSLSVLNPVSNYGKAKKSIEEINCGGINLRIAKLEEPFLINGTSLINRILRQFIFIPVPSGLSVQVTEIDQILEEIGNFVSEDFFPDSYTLKYETYKLDKYLKKYYGLRSFVVPKILVDVFFNCCNSSRTRTGRLLYDRWVSLVSTDQFLRQEFTTS
jgi:hypothetical protein